MKLFHAHYANQKLSHAGKILACDANGVVELSDADSQTFFQETLGFRPVPEKKGAAPAPKLATKVEDLPKHEAPKEDENNDSDEEDEDEAPAPKASLKKQAAKAATSRFKRGDA